VCVNGGGDSDGNDDYVNVYHDEHFGRLPHATLSPLRVLMMMVIVLVMMMMIDMMARKAVVVPMPHCHRWAW
jgi:hypothetical protein